MDALNILGVRVDCIEKKTLLELVEEWSWQPRQRTIAYVNAHCLNVAYQDPVYRDFLNQTDLNYADGISVVWVSRLLGGPRLKKVTGRDWIGDFCNMAEKNRLRIYILAGKPGIARKAWENILDRHPAINIVGTCDGFFSEKSQAVAIREMNGKQAQVVFVGLGVGLQEKWIAENREDIAAPICWGVGALFDYVAGVERTVPAWMDRLGLEWLWRLMLDPSHKWKRYLIGNPLLVVRVLRQMYLGRKQVQHDQDTHPNNKEK